jgi:hypothetical protein
MWVAFEDEDAPDAGLSRAVVLKWVDWGRARSQIAPTSGCGGQPTI